MRRDQACEPLHDQARSGRPPKADAAAQKHMVMAAKLPECRTAADIAAKLQQDHHLNFNVPTVKRLLRQNGLQHLSPVARPMLTDNHKLARVRFARADNAKPHKTATNMAYSKDSVPGGHFLTWPACSPDLSPFKTCGPGWRANCTRSIKSRI